MGHCYSLDLRVRVAGFVEAGHSAKPKPAPSTRSGAPSATSATCSNHTSAGTISGPPAMRLFNRPML